LNAGVQVEGNECPADTIGSVVIPLVLTADVRHNNSS